MHDITQVSFKDRISKIVAKAAGVEVEKIWLEHPDQEIHGDYSTNIALLMKGGREMADKIASAIKPDEVIAKVEVAGPGFVNVFIRSDYLVNQLAEVLTQGKEFGKKNSGQGKKVIIDYSAPNIAKPFGIGHLRSTIVGQALYNLYKFLGYEVIGDNHLGDWGTQFGKLLYMIELENPGELNIEKLEELYVKFHKLAEADTSLEDKAREWFKKLESGDEKARELWKQCWDVSMTEFNRIYDLLGIKIDETLGESFYEDKMAVVIDRAKKQGVAIQSEGAWVIEVSGTNVPVMLLKSDGATTYATRDLATIAYRMERWDPVKMIYEVGAEQILHFVQVFGAARRMGYVADQTELVHTGHGLYLDTDGKKFATRKGKTVKLEEVLSIAIERAKKLGNMDEETAKAVGIGAIKYFDLKHGVRTDIVFDWEKMFELAGNSGPYLQYTYARIQSVQSKSGRAGEQEIGSTEVLGGYEPNAEEMAVLRWVYRFPEVVEEAAVKYSPNLVCNFVYELAQRFNGFYNKYSILTPDESGRAGERESISRFRLKLAQATGLVLKNGLGLLGIEVLDRM